MVADVDRIYGDLPSSWRTVSISMLVEQGDANFQTGPFGTMLHASSYCDTGTPVVAVKNIGENRLDDADIPRVNEETHNRLSKYVIREGDILFGRKGAVERRAFVREREDGWLQGSDCIRLRIFGSDADPRYVSYVLGSPQHRGWIVQRSHGATMPSLNQEILGRIPLPLPSLKEQQAIANILGTLDDKIELNRKMNRPLETMAQAIFKSWFVDFDLSRAKAEGRDPGLPKKIADLFPDSFDNSELGKIPNGWKLVPLPEMIDVNPARPLRKGTIAPYLDMANMPSRGHSPNLVIDRHFGSGMRFINGDTLVARITPCLENGKTAYVDFLDDGQIGWGSTEYIILRPKSPLPLEFAYCLARSDNFREFAIQSMTGSSGRQRVPAEALSHYQLVQPSRQVAALFGHLVHPLFIRASKAASENRTLATLRDTLLPKLISGELRVKDAEHLAEARQ